MITNISKIAVHLTDIEKEKIKNQSNYTEEKFYRYKFGWGLIFPDLNDEEIEDLAWNSFLY